MLSEVFTEAKLTSGEILIRCHFCGDSDNHNHSHLYIKEMDGVGIFYCQRCQTKGIVNNDFFSSTDAEFDNFIASEYLGVLKSKRFNAYKKRGVQSLKINLKIKHPTKKSEIYDRKVDYIKERTLGDFNIRDLNVVLSIKNLIRDNPKYIGTNLFKQGFLDVLENEYIGFLLSGNTGIVFRKVSNGGKEEDWKRRYFAKSFTQNVSRIYIPKKFDDTLFNKKNDVTVALCEGNFDVNNIYENFYKGRDDVIVGAVLNKDYISKIGLLIDELGIRIKHFDFYLDSDVTYFKQFKYIKPMATFYKTSDENEKDWGEKRKIGRRIIKVV